MGDTGFDLSGRRAVVTGASTGIGASIAVRLAGAGAAVAALSRRGTAPDHERITAIAADLADPDQLDAVVDRAVAALGGIDIVVNNAGIAEWVPFVDLDRQTLDRAVTLNLWAPLRLCQLAHPHLTAARDAAVVMIGSIDATRPSAGAVAYGASKAALGAATVALAKEWAADGIRVTQVDPGLVATPMAADAVAEVEAADAAINLAGRVGTPDEIAGLVHYLVSPLGRFAVGASFRVDGGALALGPFDMRDG